MWDEWIDNRAIALRRPLDGIAHFPKALQPVDTDAFKCLTNLLIARYEPERKFVTALVAQAGLFDAFFKNADGGFYGFPYAYKSSLHARTHSKTETFNPDFFLKLAGRDVVLVVEIKGDDDDSARNKAKLRDAREHFEQLNTNLEAAGKRWRYHFYFLSEADYGHFFRAVGASRLGFRSSLMNQLETI